MELERKLLISDVDLQLFADAGNLVNTQQNYVNAYTGAVTAFDQSNTLEGGNKVFYGTKLLENARDETIFAQLGDHEPLPENKGSTVEWSKFNTLPDPSVLIEGVIPTGVKMGMTHMTVPLIQHGIYTAISDRVDVHYVHPVVLAATEEVGASCGRGIDKIARAALMQGTNVMYADAVNKLTGAFVSTPASRNALTMTDEAFCGLTPDMIAKAKTKLVKGRARKWPDGGYVCVIHPSVAYDLTRNPEWIDVHKYTNAVEMVFKGEIGKLSNVRFIENMSAPIVMNTAASPIAIYQCIFLGYKAYKVVDPAGGGIEHIIKDKGQVGGPLNQFSTVGGKYESAAKIVYPDSVVIVECASAYSAIDKAN